MAEAVSAEKTTGLDWHKLPEAFHSWYKSQSNEQLRIYFDSTGYSDDEVVFSDWLIECPWQVEAALMGAWRDLDLHNQEHMLIAYMRHTRETLGDLEGILAALHGLPEGRR